MSLSWSTRRWAAAPALALLVLGLAGCGRGGTIGSPRVPLTQGAHVAATSRRCDQGKHVFCGLYLVVVDSHFSSSQALMSAERRRLRAYSWTVEQGDIGQEQSAVSPGEKFRLTYATAEGELRAIDEGWIQRPSAISLALAHAMFDRTAAMSLIVRSGPS